MPVTAARMACFFCGVVKPKAALCRIDSGEHDGWMCRKVSSCDGRHGGKRRGAGRPRSIGAWQTRSVVLDQRAIDGIKAVATEEGLTFSGALRIIVACYLVDRCNVI